MNVLLFCCKGFEMMEFAPFYDALAIPGGDHLYGFYEEANDVAFLLMEKLQ